MSNAVAKRADSPMQSAGPVTPMQMLQVAMDQGADLEKLEKLMELHEKWEVNQARKQYNAAMTEFKSNPPRLLRDKKGHQGNKYASHQQVMSAIAQGLSEHGLSHTFQMAQAEGVIRVTCRISHVDGHSESVSLSAEPDRSGSKNSIQAVGSTVTYLERYTLLAATGLGADDMSDDDGKGAAQPLVTDTEIKVLRAKLEKVGKDEQKLLDWLKCDHIEQLTMAEFDRSIKMLNRAEREQEKAGA